MNHTEMKKFLNYHDNLYYNNDKPEISDEEYDAVKRKYIEKYGEYNYVPGNAKEDSIKYEHTTNVSSLKKCQITDIKELKKNIEALLPVVIQRKFDGLTIVTYPDEDVTRGNGRIGEVVTQKMSKVKGIGKRYTLPIRSEVLMLKSEFDKINKERISQGLEPFKNTRNAAAGMIRNKDITKIKGLKAFAYNIIYDKELQSNLTSYSQIEKLKELGWNTAETFLATNIEQALSIIEMLKEERDSLDYDIDGLVVKHAGSKSFGETGHHPNNAFAIKFESEGEWTSISGGISWQTGRTGKITPVLNIEPVEILGSTVKNATLHNYGFVKAIGLDTWNSKTKVRVIKSNDVIPKVVEVDKSKEDELSFSAFEEEPGCCPVCFGKVEKVNDQIFCINEACPAKTTARLVHMAQRDAFDIDQLSEKTAIKLIDLYEKQNPDVEDIHPSFIYELSYEDILSLDGFAEVSAEKLYKELKKSLNLSFDRFLYGIGIPLIGYGTAKKIAEFYYDGVNLEIENFVNDYYNGFEKLKNCKDVGPVTINSLNENYEKFFVPFGQFQFNISDIIPKKIADNQMTFVITGEFEIPRKQIKAMIEEAGHKISGSVSKKTNYLLAAPGEEGTSKYKKAKEINTTIINSLKELEELI